MLTRNTKMKRQDSGVREIDRAGAMLVLVVLTLPVVLAFSAFAVNIAYMQLTRTELRTASDAAARAASRTLSLTQDVNAARAAAVDAASRNLVAGTPMTLRDTDVVFGSSEPDIAGRYDFTAQSDTSNKLTGVRVNANRTAGSADGSIPLLFQGIFDAGTFEPVRETVASHTDRDVFLILDRSGSMTTATPGGNRWKDLRKAVRAFVKILRKTPQSEQVGLATYSTAASLDEKLSKSYNKLLNKVDNASVSGWTAIGEGMKKGISGLEDPATARPIAAKTLVVMTDGRHNRGVNPDVIAMDARSRNITVHTITFSAGANQTLMKEVARVGGGKHWHADDQDELVHVFEEVANNLPTLITK